jgi:hypothetical protein
MKIRQGFVSNSSSSSFVVAFPRRPKDAADLQDLVFGSEIGFPNPWPDEDEPLVYSAADGAEAIWKQLAEELKPVGAAEIALELDDFMDGNWLHGYTMCHPLPYDPHDWQRPSKMFPSFSPSEEKLSWQEKRALPKMIAWERKQAEEAQAFQDWAARCAAAFVAENGSECYVFSFADEDGSFSAAMEHGPVFRRLPYIRISHH